MVGALIIVITCVHNINDCQCTKPVNSDWASLCLFTCSPLINFSTHRWRWVISRSTMVARWQEARGVRGTQHGGWGRYYGNKTFSPLDCSSSFLKLNPVDAIFKMILKGELIVHDSSQWCVRVNPIKTRVDDVT